jgi:hypothetical protein
LISAAVVVVVGTTGPTSLIITVTTYNMYNDVDVLQLEAMRNDTNDGRKILCSKQE